MTTADGSREVLKRDARRREVRGRDGQGAGGILGWCFYDWANSAFVTVVGTFVFSVYYGRGIVGDEIAGSAQWGYAMGLAGLVVAVLAPVLGAIADRAGRLKPWIMVLTVISAGAAAGLWWAEPDPDFALYALGLVVVGTVAIELAMVFYNAMLPSVAPPRLLGRVSGWAWGLGYFGGLGALGLSLALIQPEVPPLGLDKDAAEPVRATGLVVAAWLVLFTLPLLLFTRDAPSTGIGMARAAREGLGGMVKCLGWVWRNGSVLRFLVASALYRDGLGTLFAVGAIFAAGTIGLDYGQIILFGLGLNVTAGLGAALFGFMDDSRGSRATIFVALAGLILFGTPLLFVSEPATFILLALVMGLFVGPAQAAGRSMMARMSPAGMQTELFGLYAFAGKSTAFLGPLLFGLLVDITANQRIGMATVVVFWVLGAVILATVKPAR